MTTPTMLAPGLTIQGITPPLDPSAFKLIAFDMDSTLINIECIDEIAAMVGKGTEVAAITEAAMRGEIADYKESLRRRMLLLTGTQATVLDEVFAQRLRLNPGVPELIAAAKEYDWKTMVVSGGFTYFTDRLKAQLQLDYAHSNVLEIAGGKLTGQLIGPIVDAHGKRQALEAACAQLGSPASAAIAVGDGANDLEMMRVAGLAVAYHAKPKVREKAQVSITSGGLDQLLHVFAPQTAAKPITSA